MTRWALVAIGGILTAHLASAQDVTGTWTGFGANPAGAASHRWAVNVSKDRAGELKGTVADQGPAHLLTALVSISLEGSKLTFTFVSRNGPMSFVGTLSNDGNSVEGWLFDEPLTLKRQGHPELKTPSERKDASPPSPAAISVSATPPDAESSAILSRALAKLAGTSRRLLRYSCTETIERAYYSEPAGRKMGTHPLSEAPVASCDKRAFSQDGHLRLDMEDRLRLAVAVADNTQIQSWAAASRFDSRSVEQIVPGGPMTTGPSGEALVDIFENPGTRFSFIGRKNEGSRPVFEYTFDVPLAFSGSAVRAGTEWRKTAYHGSFEIDPLSAELVRLTSESDPLPPETKMCRFRTGADYHYLEIGTGRFLLPSQSTLETVSPAGLETRSVTTFSACHEYAAESSVSFGDTAASIDGGVASKPAAPLPPGLSLVVALTKPIDLRTAAAGDAVAGRVTKAVRAPGSNAVMVDAGAVLHGRIAQMQHQYATSRFAFAIVYETLEQRGAVSPVAVELDRELKAERAGSRNTFARRGSEFSLPAPSAGDIGGSFAVSAATGGYVVAAGSESKWITVAK